MESSAGTVIRVALLGADDTTRAVVEAIQTDKQFTLAGVCELEGAEGAPLSTQALVGSARTFETWEDLLDSSRVDAVIVARGADEDRRAEQLRKFVQAGVPLLISHPVVDSMLVYYELDMIRRETGAVMLPHLSARHHPASLLLAEMVSQGGDSPIGKIEQVVCDRSIAEPTKEAVVRQFARDVDLLRGIAGDMTRLGAMAGGSGERSYGSLGVQMSGPGGVVARWSVAPSRRDSGARMTLVGEHGKATVEMSPPGEPWSLELSIDGTSDSRTYEVWSPAAASLARLAGTIAGEPPRPDWVDASRAVELAETIDRSLAKGRTVELHFEEYTEEGTFKGTMTSVGCGLLLLGLVLMGAVAIGEQAGAPLLRFWPYLLAGTFGIFLLLQLLMLVFHRPAKGAEERSGDAVTTRPDQT